jgi:DNA recombination protein RmuC
VVAAIIWAMDVTLLLAGAVVLLVGMLAGWLIGRAQRSPADRAVDVAGVLAPAADTLARVEHRLGEMERDRVGAYAGLREQVAALQRSSSELGAQTRSLAGALRAPTVRGRWGEVQLRRIVELAGMVEHCDFSEQHRSGPANADAGSSGVRPDLVVRLAGDRFVPVDAKAPMAAWLELTDRAAGDDPERRRRLATAHARALRGHIDALAGKAYWEHLQPAPDFVVMFVPGEPLLDAAMSVDPTLTEYAFARNVVVATPATLIALLRTIALGWRQERLSRSAEEIHELGRELYGRLSVVSSHLGKVGTGLGRAVDAYNGAVGSFESRVLVTARRFADLGVAGRPIRPPAPVLVQSRRPSADPDEPDIDGAIAARPDIETAIGTDDRFGAAGRADRAGPGRRDATVEG